MEKNIDVAIIQVKLQNNAPFVAFLVSILELGAIVYNAFTLTYINTNDINTLIISYKTLYLEKINDELNKSNINFIIVSPNIGINIININKIIINIVITNDFIYKSIVLGCSNLYNAFDAIQIDLGPFDAKTK